MKNKYNNQSCKYIEESSGEVFEKEKEFEDDYFAKVEEMVDYKLVNYNFRIYNSVKSEFRRWWTGHYDR